MNKYQVGVFIGRFQPFHNGHAAVVRHALSLSEHVLLLCGSSNTPRTLKNPFTFEEREAMIRDSLTPEESARLWLAPIEDYPYDDSTWVLNVQHTVAQILSTKNIPYNAKIALIGHKKDESSYYLNLFPEWSWERVENFQGISATPIRDLYWRLPSGRTLPTELPIGNAVAGFLNDFLHTTAYADLYAEQSLLDMEKNAWSAAPYPPVFVTTDALVVHQNEVLLVKRGNHPGKGLYAMPGGFLEQNETLYHSCLRELSEETGIALNETIWRGFLRQTKTYDAIGRSPRGRIITHIFHFHLPDDVLRPIVVGGDDAEKAFWMPLGQLNAKDFHDDHFHIIREMTSI